MIVFWWAFFRMWKNRLCQKWVWVFFLVYDNRLKHYNMIRNHTCMFPPSKVLLLKIWCMGFIYFNSRFIKDCWWLQCVLLIFKNSLNDNQTTNHQQLFTLTNIVGFGRYAACEETASLIAEVLRWDSRPWKALEFLATCPELREECKPRMACFITAISCKNQW